MLIAWGDADWLGAAGGKWVLRLDHCCARRPRFVNTKLVWPSAPKVALFIVSARNLAALPQALSRLSLTKS